MRKQLQGCVTLAHALQPAKMRLLQCWQLKQRRLPVAPGQLCKARSPCDRAGEAAAQQQHFLSHAWLRIKVHSRRKVHLSALQSTVLWQCYSSQKMTMSSCMAHLSNCILLSAAAVRFACSSPIGVSVDSLLSPCTHSCPSCQAVNS